MTGEDVISAALPEIGHGIYSVPEATQIVRRGDMEISARQLRYWMTSGLTPASHVSDAGASLLTFDDLVSLELVRRFRSLDVSLQRVRKFEARLRHEFPSLARPFAYELFWTDGATIWAREQGSDGGIVIELVGKRPGHFAWGDAIRTFAKEVHYTLEGDYRHASSWSLSPWVEIDPRVQFGSPVVRGTRVPIRTIAANLEVGTTAEVADWYGLSVQQVEGVRNYLALV